jgi:Mg-chelatase subunit ChlD
VPSETDRLKRWRLILGGGEADGISQGLGEEGGLQLSATEIGIDGALSALYDSQRGGLGPSSPNVTRWLGDIREYFPSTVVQVMQKDAMERLGLRQMLLEPESLANVEVDVNLVATLISLSSVIPAKTRDTARQVVRQLVEEVEKKLANPLRQAVQGALARSVRNRRPKHREIDWHRTIKANLKNYQPEYKSIIPEIRIGYGRKGQALRDVILCIDQSGSMASSVVYSAIFGGVMASIRALKTHMVLFDTSVVDLTDQVADPIDLLFSTRLGGGTDINQALTYCQSLIRNPSDTILILISDLIEGGNREQLLQRAASMKASGVQVIALLALTDQGKTSFDHANAAHLASMDIPCFACTPDLFPEMMAVAIRKGDMRQWVQSTTTS